MERKEQQTNISYKKRWPLVKVHLVLWPDAVARLITKYRANNPLPLHNLHSWQGNNSMGGSVIALQFALPYLGVQSHDERYRVTCRRNGTYGIMTVGLGSQICLNISISLYSIFSIFAVHFT